MLVRQKFRELCIRAETMRLNSRATLDGVAPRPQQAVALRRVGQKPIAGTQLDGNSVTPG